jgi:hypothetical protein
MILLRIKEDFIMAACAREIEAEMSMEERLARLEERTGYLQADVTDIKSRLERMEARFDAKFQHLTAEIRAGFDGVNKRFESYDTKLTAWRDEMTVALNKIHVGRALDKVWALLAMAALLGVMARGFKWI